MYSYQKVFLIVCVTLSCVDIYSGNDTQAWSPRSPNFDPEYPQFTPFNSNEFFHLNGDLKDDQALDSDIPKPNQVTPQNTETLSDLQDHFKPLKNLVFGLYQNYRNSYFENKTSNGAEQLEENELDDVENKIDENSKPKKIRTKNKSKKKSVATTLLSDEIKYNVGPGVNVSLDHEKELVNVFLDEDCLKDVFTGRGKKYDLISKILPLFILPFLIQSAIVPFIVTTLKLFLVKSIIVGKIAIFLLILSAFKNHIKYNYEPPAYYVDPPSRRSESTPGYRVEGKPTTWVN